MHIFPSRILRRCVAATILFAFSAVLFAQNPVFEPKVKPLKATVVIRAMSYRVHSGSLGSRDVYIADLMMAPGEHQTVLLLDEYHESEMPMAETVLAEHLPLRMQVVRDRACDRTQGKLMLPSDPKMLYELGLAEELGREPEASVPCYRTVHGSIAIAKR